MLVGWRRIVVGVKPSRRVISNTRDYQKGVQKKPVVKNASTIEGMFANYRANGHLAASLDPLGITMPSKLPSVTPEIVFSQNTDGDVLVGGQSVGDLHSLEGRLRRIYSGNVGFEIAHVEEATEREWLYNAIEATGGLQASSTLRKHLAKVLLESEGFDQFMAKRYGQVKRYGLNGGEAMMIAVDSILTLSSANHIIIGMPHRGRLNLMVGLLGFPAEAIFHKLSGVSELPSEWPGSADVLSHLSHTGEVKMGEKVKKVSILPNPSHLEAVNPVHQGVVFAHQNHFNESALALQIHGDAAFSGQGIVQETLQMSQLEGFAVGGTIHLIVNNQLGYTATARMGRSSQYSSAPAKMIGAPIFHVNGDSPEDVVRATSIAMQYRQQFGKDIVLDLICYRRMGHNELDEPSFTQPLMYQNIHKRESLPEAYSKMLINEKIMGLEEVEDIKKSIYNTLDGAVQKAKEYIPVVSRRKFGLQKNTTFESLSSSSSGVPKQLLVEAGKQSVQLPNEFATHSRLQKYHIDARLSMMEGEKVDWATAEAMAIGSLLHDGFNVRLVGQDVQRGTFSHRHFIFHDQKTGVPIVTFNQWPKALGKLSVINSHLSEAAVIGFEYGLSIADPLKTLPIWEAQFGDFFNGAQSIIDTFLSSGQTKWGLQSGLVLMLPHGYDGTGPEHSSCRIERFLQMSNAPYDGTTQFIPNWHVVHPTTPANYFHLLRRQLIQSFRRPLIMAAPKTLLRLPAAVSDIADMLEGTEFRPVISDPRNIAEANVVVLCSGKFYYEIEKERASRNVESMAIIRIEELCPLPAERLLNELSKFKDARMIWCQEEHRNMGPYDYIAPRIQSLLPPGKILEYVGREVASAPAAGYSQLHKAELANIWKKLFD